ncbi:MAG: hypothetical protein WKF51_09795 [Geodermatophilaceae bacterium]
MAARSSSSASLKECACDTDPMFSGRHAVTRNRVKSSNFRLLRPDGTGRRTGGGVGSGSIRRDRRTEWIDAQDAALLLRYCLSAPLRRDVSDLFADHANRNARQLRDALSALESAIGQDRNDVVLASVDLPCAVVRRILQTGRTPDASDVNAVRRAAALLLGSSGPRTSPA